MKTYNNLIVAVSTIHSTPIKIEYLNYDSYDADHTDLYRTANLLKQEYDEVYLVNFDPSNSDFIKEITEHGIRI